MKNILYEACNYLAFIAFMVVIFFLWVGFEDSDIINLKSAISIDLSSLFGG